MKSKTIFGFIFFFLFSISLVFAHASAYYPVFPDLNMLQYTLSTIDNESVKFNETFNYNTLFSNSSIGRWTETTASSCGNEILTPSNISLYNPFTDSTGNYTGFGRQMNNDISRNGSCGFGYSTILKGRAWTSGLIGTSKWIIKFDSMINSSYCNQNVLSFPTVIIQGISTYDINLYSTCDGNATVAFKNAYTGSCIVSTRNAPNYNDDRVNEYALYLDEDNDVYSLYLNGYCGSCCFKEIGFHYNKNISKVSAIVSTVLDWESGTHYMGNILITRINEISGYNPVSTSPEINVPDVLAQRDTIWNSLGLKSAGSRAIFGVILILFINIALIMLFLRAGQGLGMSHYYIMIGVTVITSILNIFLGLFQWWLLFVLILIGVGLGALGLKNASHGG